MFYQRGHWSYSLLCQVMRSHPRPIPLRARRHLFQFYLPRLLAEAEERAVAQEAVWGLTVQTQAGILVAELEAERIPEAWRMEQAKERINLPRLIKEEADSVLGHQEPHPVQQESKGRQVRVPVAAVRARLPRVVADNLTARGASVVAGLPPRQHGLLLFFHPRTHRSIVGLRLYLPHKRPKCPKCLHPTWSCQRKWAVRPLPFTKKLFLWLRLAPSTGQHRHHGNNGSGYCAHPSPRMDEWAECL